VHWRDAQAGADEEVLKSPPRNLFPAEPGAAAEAVTELRSQCEAARGELAAAKAEAKTGAQAGTAADALLGKAFAAMPGAAATGLASCGAVASFLQVNGRQGRRLMGLGLQPLAMTMKVKPRGQELLCVLLSLAALWSARLERGDRAIRGCLI
jgi:hypothetical protein